MLVELTQTVLSSILHRPQRLTEEYLHGTDNFIVFTRCRRNIRHKSPTTDDPSQGIEKVITTLFQKSNLDPSSISSVTIGTTVRDGINSKPEYTNPQQHFVNAVIEKDHNRLAPVAIIRLCGPFSQDVPPGVDWPEDLRNLICVHTAYLKGGLEVDGDLISAIDETEIIKECDIIKAKGIKSVVINGIFSPSDLSEKQEESARDIVRKHLPDTNIVISKEGLQRF